MIVLFVIDVFFKKRGGGTKGCSSIVVDRYRTRTVNGSIRVEEQVDWRRLDVGPG